MKRRTFLKIMAWSVTISAVQPLKLFSEREWCETKFNYNENCFKFIYHAKGKPASTIDCYVTDELLQDRTALRHYLKNFIIQETSFRKRYG